MSIKVITAPTFEPVSLAEARLHLRIADDQTAEDAMIASLIVAARIEAEHRTGYALATQTLEIALEAWPADGDIELPRPPFVSVTSVKYTDADGNEQTVDPGDYTVDSHLSPAWLLRAYGVEWPTARKQANAVRVRYVAGYAQGACPEVDRSWIKMRVGTLYENRNADAERPVAPSPFADRLLDPYRVIAL